MTADGLPTTVAGLLRHAAVRAALAPSVHNTQPWRLVLHPDHLDLRLDPDRRLGVIDPRGRQQLISVGCALLHARVALARMGVSAEVERFPDPADHELVARVTVGGPTPWSPLVDLDAAIDERRTNRRPYLDDDLEPRVQALLVEAAAIEGARLEPVLTTRGRVAVARACATADLVERSDPDYLDELERWTSDDPRRPDGVPAASVPFRPAGAPATLVRAFDQHGSGWLPSPEAGLGRVFVLCTDGDDPPTWLGAGEALERVWLELTRAGLHASPVSQVVEVRKARDELCAQLDLDCDPQLLLRVGRAPLVSPTPRRPLAEVVEDHTADGPENPMDGPGATES